MKSQNNNKLVFGKTTISELNDSQLTQINGGSLSKLLSLLSFTVPIV